MFFNFKEYPENKKNVRSNDVKLLIKKRLWSISGHLAYIQCCSALITSKIFSTSIKISGFNSISKSLCLPVPISQYNDNCMYLAWKQRLNEIVLGGGYSCGLGVGILHHFREASRFSA